VGGNHSQVWLAYRESESWQKRFIAQKQPNTACSGQERGFCWLPRVSAKSVFSPFECSRQSPALAANACRWCAKYRTKELIMNTGITKDIFLLLAGGLITLVVTVITNRIQARKAFLTWRLLPPVMFTAQGVTTFNLAIENSGSADAENVRVAIQYPKETIVESFEVQTSEKAMAYEILTSGNGNEFLVEFSTFPKDLDCILAFLARNINPDDIVVSIIGKEVVGKEKTADYKTKSEQFRRFSLLINVFSLVISLLLLGGTVVYSYVIGLANANYAQSLDIAELYIETGHPELAIQKYEGLTREWWFPTTTQMYYRLASAYALTNDSEKSVHYLRIAITKDAGILSLLKVDSAFDGIRSTDEFKALIAEFR
jgi:hypothetical protein